MSGIHGEVLGHLVRRGVEAVRATPEQQYIQYLVKQAHLYEDAGPDAEVKPWQFLTLIATALVFIAFYLSVRQQLWLHCSIPEADHDLGPLHSWRSRRYARYDRAASDSPCF